MSGAVGSGLLGPDTGMGVTGTMALEVGAEERGSKWRQEVGFGEVGAQRWKSSCRSREAPGQFCGWSPKLAEAGGASSFLWFASLSLGTAATVISGSVGVVALILLLVGLLSMTLKKWRHESKLSKLALDLRMKRWGKLGVERGVAFLWGSLGDGRSG